MWFYETKREKDKSFTRQALKLYYFHFSLVFYAILSTLTLLNNQTKQQNTNNSSLRREQQPFCGHVPTSRHQTSKGISAIRPIWRTEWKEQACSHKAVDKCFSFESPCCRWLSSIQKLKRKLPCGEHWTK